MFVDDAQFPFLEDLRCAWRDICAECLALNDDSFEPWVQREMYGTGWSVYGLIAFGARIDEALATCPRTAEALQRVAGLTTAGFSRMVPGAHIRPHQGWVTTVYRGHLGLVVPCRRETGPCGWFGDPAVAGRQPVRLRRHGQS